ncbi:hypothetical protein C8R47DRAFT_1205127 [Mycena vitilis]|nr:hypothetical protein C8R47DRAFT_1205127 [Mycena vitilis]
MCITGRALVKFMPVWKPLPVRTQAAAVSAPGLYDDMPDLCDVSDSDDDVPDLSEMESCDPVSHEEVQRKRMWINGPLMAMDGNFRLSPRPAADPQRGEIYANEDFSVSDMASILSNNIVVSYDIACTYRCPACPNNDGENFERAWPKHTVGSPG